MQAHIKLVEDGIREQSNPVRRRKAELCLKQHGNPAHGHHFIIHERVMKVVKEDGFERRSDELAIQDPWVSEGHLESCMWLALFVFIIVLLATLYL